MNFNLKLPSKKNKKDHENFFIENNFSEFIKLSKTKNQKINELEMKNSFKPELNDLFRLYEFVKLNNRTTILEFGSGWSSLVFAYALDQLKKTKLKKAKSLRRNNLFELFVIENEKKYLNKIKKKFNQKKYKNIKSNVNFHFANVKMINYNGNIATEYDRLPLCNPDFIYIDGPGQFNVKGNVNGISTNHYDMMPMICDILKIEYFLIPGTIILVDGRSANAFFLRDNYKRKWSYFHDRPNDQHIFCLKDKPLGHVNERLLEFYKSN